MRSLRTLITASAIATTLGSLSMGCLDTGDSLDESYEVPGLSALTGGNGSEPPNGLQPVLFNAYMAQLLAATGHAVADPSFPARISNEVSATGLLSTAEGRRVFKYAVRCALPVGTSVMTADEEVFEGEGLMTTTHAWTDGALSTSQQEDLFTCLLTLLNPSATEVRVWISGPNVKVTGVAPARIDKDEAVWLATVGAGGQLTFNIWPGADLSLACGATIDEHLTTRICNDPDGGCGLVIRDDFATARTGTDSSFTCDGKPAIKTALGAPELALRHPECDAL